MQCPTELLQAFPVSHVAVRRNLKGLTKCNYELGQYDSCIGASEALLKMNRQFPGVRKYMALALKAQGKLDEAIRTMQRAVLYETPFNDENKDLVWKLYKELCAELELRE